MQVIITTLLLIVQKWETTQMTINERMNKQSIVNPYNGLLLKTKRNKLLINTKSQMNLKNFILNKRRQTQKVRTALFHL